MAENLEPHIEAFIEDALKYRKLLFAGIELLDVVYAHTPGIMEAKRSMTIVSMMLGNMIGTYKATPYTMDGLRNTLEDIQPSQDRDAHLAFSDEGHIISAKSKPDYRLEPSRTGQSHKPFIDKSVQLIDRMRKFLKTQYAAIEKCINIQETFDYADGTHIRRAAKHTIIAEMILARNWLGVALSEYQQGFSDVK